MHKFHMSILFHLCNLGLMSWIWTSPSIEGLKFESPSKWNLYEGFNLEHLITFSFLNFNVYNWLSIVVRPSSEPCTPPSRWLAKSMCLFIAPTGTMTCHKLIYGIPWTTLWISAHTHLLEISPCACLFEFKASYGYILRPMPMLYILTLYIYTNPSTNP